MADSGAFFFVLMAGLAGSMALVYVPLRIFLTATARSPVSYTHLTLPTMRIV